jgi:hypothetical protein
MEAAEMIQLRPGRRFVLSTFLAAPFTVVARSVNAVAQI